jgi:hypothetical protein
LYGEADEVYSDRAFVLEGNEWLFDHELLVLTRDPIDLEGHGIEDGAKLVVTGEIQSLVTADIEREIEWDLDTELVAKFESKPVLIADAITATEDLVRWTDEPEPTIVSMWGVYAEPNADALEGRIVEFASAPVLSPAGEAVWIGNEHGGQLLVAPPKHTHADAEPGDRVVVQGRLRKMPSPQEAMETWKVPAEFEGQLSEEPLYVAATLIETLPGEPEKSAAAPSKRAGG